MTDYVFCFDPAKVIWNYFITGKLDDNGEIFVVLIRIS